MEEPGEGLSFHPMRKGYAGCEAACFQRAVAIAEPGAARSCHQAGCAQRKNHGDMVVMPMEYYDRQMGYRAVDRYILFYVVKNTEVQIHRILYGRRDYLSLL